MSLTIKHFMWGYQPIFRVSQEAAVKRVFKLLDGRFNPKIFLVGILIDNLEDRYVLSSQQIVSDLQQTAIKPYLTKFNWKDFWISVSASVVGAFFFTKEHRGL